MTDCCGTHGSLFPQYSHPNFLTLSHVVVSLRRHALLSLLQCSLFVLLRHTVIPYYLHMKRGGGGGVYCNYPSLVSAHLSQLNLASPVLWSKFALIITVLDSSIVGLARNRVDGNELNRKCQQSFVCVREGWGGDTGIEFEVETENELDRGSEDTFWKSVAGSHSLLKTVWGLRVAFKIRVHKVHVGVRWCMEKV